MNFFSKLSFSTIFLVFIFSLQNVHAEEQVIKELKTSAKSDFYISDAAFFKVKGKKEKAIVFVPGFIFNKESWKSLAEQFQASGTAALTVNGKSAVVVKAAVRFLSKKGYKDIVLMGGSSGAAAILEVLPEVSRVSKVILLSPPRGASIDNTEIDKLFVTSADERLFPKVRELFEATTYPKTIKVFEGSAHAQFLFYGPKKDELISIVNDFVNN